MIITDKSWKRFIADLRKLSDKAAELTVAYMETHEYSTPAGRQKLIEYAYAVATKYGEGATEKACQMYDAVAERTSPKPLPPAEPAKTATYQEVGKAVNGTMLQSVLPVMVGMAVGRLVKMAGVDTTLNNAIRDGAEWAWISVGDSCPYCLGLASEGWSKASKSVLKNGHSSHIHANCDCTYAVRHDGKSNIEGYEPEKIEEQFKEAEGTTVREKMNYLRRQKHAKKNEGLRTQKAGKSIDKRNTSKYNKSPSESELRKRYERDVDEGWISALCGFDNYKELYDQIEEQVVGMKTRSGVVITSQSEHFLTRIIGTSLNPARIENGVYSITGVRPQGFRSNARSGVEISDVVEAIKNGRYENIKVNVNGRSQRIIGKNCVVTINPDNGVLIQCNPGGDIE